MPGTFPAPTPRVRDETLVGESAGSGIGVLIVLGLVFGAIGLGVGGFSLREGEWGATIFGSIFALIGALCIGGAVKKSLATKKLEPPSLTLSVRPLYLGETFRGELVQRVKKEADINSVTVTLICREWVRYTQGTDTHTETHDVYTVKETLDVTGMIAPPDCIRGHVEFEIPEEAMHSFSAPDNRVEWLIEVHTDVADWPDYSSKFELNVAARLASQSEGV
jgi:hypothetical protein